jgi:HK97 gp10 family phage protein
MRISARVQFTPRSSTGRFVEIVIRPGVTASVKAACDQLLQTAQNYAPVETGALRDSITQTVDDSGKTVVGSVSADVYYAAYVEYGTGKRGAASEWAGPYPYSPTWPGMTPRPYLRPAMDELRPALLDLFRGAISLAM